MSRILAIETSCDETAIALIEASGGIRAPRFKILKEAVASQIETHRKWGGVVPILAKREHLKNLPIIFKRIIGRNFQFSISNFQKKIDLIAVTVGPGLAPCLWTGINFAKEIREKHFPKARLIGVNHLHGHLYSFLPIQISILRQAQGKNLIGIFPAISLIVSGGHTILGLMESLTEYKKLGETKDDAAGEAFDKAAKMLGLPYPGGPEIEKLARRGDPSAINFPRPMIHHKNYDFSFSGLKTAVLYFIREVNQAQAFGKFPSGTGRSSAPAAEAALRSRSAGSSVPEETEPGRAPRASVRKLSEGLLNDIAASFQKAAIDVLVTKTLRAAGEYRAKSIMLSGGVAANKALQKEFQTRIKKSLVTNYQLLVTRFPTDNAVMIAAAAYINSLRKKNYRLTAQPNLDL